MHYSIVKFLLISKNIILLLVISCFLGRPETIKNFLRNFVSSRNDTSQLVLPEIRPTNITKVKVCDEGCLFHFYAKSTKRI